MRFRNSTPAVFVFLAVLLSSSCGGLATRNHAPLVFAINLSTAPVSLSLLKDDEVLVGFANLAPRESRVLTRVAPTEGAVLQWDSGDGTTHKVWTDPSGTPYALQLRAGLVYAAVLAPDGSAQLFTIPEAYTNDPKLCVMNVSGRVLSQVQAAPDWAKNVKVYLQDLTPLVPSEFYSFPAKTLGLYWQTVGQVKTNAHTVALGSDGEPLRQEFKPDHYYLFLAGADPTDLRDLTPTSD